MEQDRGGQYDPVDLDHEAAIRAGVVGRTRESILAEELEHQDVEPLATPVMGPMKTFTAPDPHLEEGVDWV